jgi:preprotein translocase subunit SecY
VIGGVIAVTQAQRKIPVQYAKRVVGRKVYGGQSTYMPLRVNYSGVMPIIFAQAILMFPQACWHGAGADAIKEAAEVYYGYGPIYMVLYSLMILFFSYFWVATQFNPVQIADDLKKYGGYVPGHPPRQADGRVPGPHDDAHHAGRRGVPDGDRGAADDHGQQFRIPWMVAQFFGGTSLLIIVGVMLDTMRQIESHLVMRHYDGFLRKGHLRGRRDCQPPERPAHLQELRRGLPRHQHPLQGRGDLRPVRRRALPARRRQRGDRPQPPGGLPAPDRQPD